MSWIKLLTAGVDGDPSTMRVATLIIVLTVMGAWCVCSIKAGELQPLSAEQMGLVLGALGMKAVQRKFEEEKKPTP